MVTLENLKNNELFQGLSDTELKEVFPFCKDKTFDAGTTIYKYEERGTEFFLLLDGDVNLQIPTEKEFGISVVFVRVGSAFGFSAMFEPHTYTSTAKCYKTAKVIAINIDPFLDFISNKNNQIGFLVMKNLARILMNRLDATRQNLRNLVSQVPISIP
jgi:CRP-like cAMP-binding protein